MNSRRLMVPQVECLNPSTGVVVGKIDAVKAAKAIGDIPQNVNFAVSLGTLQFFPEAGTGLPEGAMALGLVSSYSRTSPKADNQRRAQCAISGSARVLFNHLVCMGKQRGRHVEAKGLRGLEIDNELKRSAGVAP